MARLHGVIEKPILIAPGKQAVPSAAIGVVEHAAGVDMQAFYDQVPRQKSARKLGIGSSDASSRVVIAKLEKPSMPNSRHSR